MTLQLELGKKYLNRRGEVVEIVYDRGYDVTHRWESQYGDSYTDTGAYFNGTTDERDLVSERGKISTSPVETTTKVPNVHKDLIIAWANGETIQFFDSGHWYDDGTPDWNPKTTYRIKPEKKVVTKRIFTSVDTGYTEGTKPNLELTFEDGKLIKAEVL